MTGPRSLESETSGLVVAIHIQLLPHLLQAGVVHEAIMRQVRLHLPPRFPSNSFEKPCENQRRLIPEQRELVVGGLRRAALDATVLAPLALLIAAHPGPRAEARVQGALVRDVGVAPRAVVEVFGDHPARLARVEEVDGRVAARLPAGLVLVQHPRKT